jgi:putative lipoprotein
MRAHSLSIIVALCLVVTALAVAIPASAQDTAVTGTVTYLQRSSLPLDAIVTVHLADVSRADAPAELISEQRIQSEGNQVPFAYSLSYDPAKIIDNHDYAVSARIEAGGKLLFTSTDRYAVITKGNPTQNVEIVVKPVGGTTEQPGTLPPTGGAPLTAVLALALAMVGAGMRMRRTD